MRDGVVDFTRETCTLGEDALLAFGRGKPVMGGEQFGNKCFPLDGITGECTVAETDEERHAGANEGTDHTADGEAAMQPEGENRDQRRDDHGGRPDDSG